MTLQLQGGNPQPEIRNPALDPLHNFTYALLPLVDLSVTQSWDLLSPWDTWTHCQVSRSTRLQG